MFGIGFSEFVLLALVMIVFIRPDDLPAFFRKLGRLYGQIKKGYGEIVAVKDEFLREMDVAAAVEEAEQPEVEPAAAKKAPVQETGADAEGDQSQKDPSESVD